MENKGKRYFFGGLFFLTLLLELSLIFLLIMSHIDWTTFLLLGLSNLLVTVVAILNVKKLNTYNKH